MLPTIDQTKQWIPDILAKQPLWVLYVLSAFGILCAIYNLIRWEKDHRKKRILPKTLCFAVLCLCTLSLLSGLQITKTALVHGAQHPFTESIVNLWNGIDRSPEESKPPEDLSGCILLYYRFGCSDCEAVYPELSKKVNGQKNIYWICTRSEIGTILRKEYPVSRVPAGAYIRTDHTGLILPLYQTTANGTLLHEQNLELLLRAQENKIRKE